MSVCIISGSRSIDNYELLCSIIVKSGFKITEIVEGECPRGVDQLAKRYALEYKIPLKRMAADWKNVSRPGAVIKTNRFGKLYDAAAGHVRNEDMAKYAAERNGACIVLWDGQSKGAASMRDLALKYKLPLYLSKITLRDEPLWSDT